jgi:predicted HTH transcriptional regulator
MTITIQPSDKGADNNAEEERSLKELLALVRENEGITQSQIEKEATGGNERLRGRLEYLVHLGKLQVTKGNRSAKHYHFIEEWETPQAFEAVSND